MQGEKQHILPPLLIIFFECYKAIHGCGKSKNIASIVFSYGNSPSFSVSSPFKNPPLYTSLQKQVAWGSFNLLSNSFPFSALSLLNSYVNNFPLDPTANANEHESEPLPVPLSITLYPGLMQSLSIIIEISAINKIYVLCGTVSVIKCGFGVIN